MKRIIGIALICIILVSVLTACGNKTALTIDEFISKSEANGMMTNSIKDDYADIDYITDAAGAGVIKDGSIVWTSNFIITTDGSMAQSMFEGNKSTFEGAGAGSTVSASSSNSDTYEKTSSEKFMYLCRVDNTLLYINADVAYKDDVKNYIKALGY